MRSNICCLTLTEKVIMKKIFKNNYNDENCISCKIIDPIYAIPNNYNDYMSIIYIILITLWIIAIYRLHNMYKNGTLHKYFNQFIILN